MPQSPVALDTRVKFSTLPAIDGYEVIDQNGRMVDKRETLQSANGVAFHLNQAAKGGPQALARALKAA